MLGKVCDVSHCPIEAVPEPLLIAWHRLQLWASASVLLKTVENLRDPAVSVNKKSVGPLLTTCVANAMASLGIGSTRSMQKSARGGFLEDPTKRERTRSSEIARCVNGRSSALFS